MTCQDEVFVVAGDDDLGHGPRPSRRLKGLLGSSLDLPGEPSDAAKRNLDGSLRLLNEYFFLTHVKFVLEVIVMFDDSALRHPGFVRPRSSMPSKKHPQQPFTRRSIIKSRLR